jgi:hypothetical protein
MNFSLNDLPKVRFRRRKRLRYTKDDLALPFVNRLDLDDETNLLIHRLRSAIASHAPHIASSMGHRALSIKHRALFAADRTFLGAHFSLPISLRAKHLLNARCYFPP